MKIKDLILISDLDGTIVPHSGEISQTNLDAIARFRRADGTFAVASGRSPIQARRVCDVLGIDGMIICNNGATIYNVASGTNVWSQPLEPRYKELVSYVIDKYDCVGVQAISGDNKYYVLKSTPFLMEAIMNIKDSQFDCKDPDELPDNICKVLFLIDFDRFDEVVADILSQPFDEFSLVQSGGACLEMMSGGINKSYPMGKLAEHYDKTIDNVVAIGDYYNDMEMLKHAHFSAAVGNAPRQVKAHADVVVKSCEDDGLAEFINILFNKYGI